MLKFWFREEMGRIVAERYANYRLIDSVAFKKLSAEEQLASADIWIAATIIGEPFEVPGSDGWKAVQVIVSSNGPNEATRALFEELGGLCQGEVDLSVVLGS